MGMDLFPLNPTDKYPTDANGEIIWGRFNWHGWGIFAEYLKSKGVDVSELAGSNDRGIISEETCKIIAHVIEQNQDEFLSAFSLFTDSGKPWIRKVITQFRECGGFEQW